MKRPMIELSLSVRSPDAPPEADERWTVIPATGAEFHVEAAVNAALEDYFDTEKWDEWFGLDESDTRVIVTVLSPENIAGSYLARLERRTKAFAQKQH